MAPEGPPGRGPAGVLVKWGTHQSSSVRAALRPRRRTRVFRLAWPDLPLREQAENAMYRVPFRGIARRA